MITRTYFVALAFLVGILLFTTAALAEEPLALRVGVYENPPKVYTNESGEVSGFWPDLIASIARLENWQIVWVHGTWAECLAKLEQNEIDILPDTGYTEQRAAIYAFSSVTVLTSWTEVYTRRGADVETILDLDGKSVGALAGSFNLDGPGGLRELIKAFEIDCTVVEMPTYTEVCEALQHGSLDAGITNKDFARACGCQNEIVRTSILFQPARMQFAFTKDAPLTPYLIDTIDRRMNEQKQDSSSVYYQALGKHLGVVPEARIETVFPLWLRNLLLGLGLAMLFVLSALWILRREVKRRTTALCESEEQFRDLYENAPNAYFSVGVDGYVLRCNRRAGELLGYAVEDIVGRSVLDLYANTEHGKDEARKILDRFKAGEVLRGGEMQMRRADGTAFWISLTLNAVRDEAGKIVESRSVVVDITERKQAEAEKLSLEEQLRQSQKLDSIGTLASGVAHEINNPLTGIINYADLIAERVTDNRLRGFAEEIVKEGYRVAGIVKSLLYFSRQEGAEHSSAQIEDLIDASLALVGASLRKDQITIEKEIAEDLPSVRCRSQQIEQVIINLLTNARDASNQRYEGYHENKRVTIRVQPLDKDGVQWVRTTIEDRGVGIPTEIICRIFDPFFTTKPRNEGTGLGLSVSHGIVKEHHGELTVDSALGEYTRFHLDLRVDNSWSLEPEGSKG